MQESQGRKPDWLNGNKSFSLKKLVQFVKKNSFKDLTADRKQRDRSVVFDALFIIFFVDRNHIGFFPFHRKFHLTKA